MRVVILSVGLVFARGASLGHFYLLAPAVYVLAALSAFTVLQRIVHVRSQPAGVPPVDVLTARRAAYGGVTSSWETSMRRISP